MRKRDIDLKDIEILNILQENALLSNKDLAKRIRLSEGPTLVRVQNLISKGAIVRYVALINPSYFGYSNNLLANVKILKEKAPAFVDRVKNIPQIVRCFHIEHTSSYELAVNEYLVTIYGKSLQECRQTLEDALTVGNIPIAIQEQPYVVKEIVKDEFLNLTPKDVR